MKLGAVVVPDSNSLTGSELGRRVQRGGIATSSSPRPAWARAPSYRPSLRALSWRPGSAVPTGWQELAAGYAEPATFDPRGADLRRGPAAPLLHLRNDGEAEARAAYPAELSGRPSPTMYWMGISHATYTSTSAPPVGQARLELVFAPWNAGATVLGRAHEKFSAPAGPDPFAQRQGHDHLRPSDGLADAPPGDLGARPSANCASSSAPASR